jgi:hypothetical protein
MVLRTALLLVGSVAASATPVLAQSRSTQASRQIVPGIAASAQAAAEETAPERRNDSTRSSSTSDAAQEPGAPTQTRLMVGIGLKQLVAPGHSTASSIAPSFVWKWRGKTRRMDDRFSLTYGLNSFSSELSPSIGGSRTLGGNLPVGDVKIRPIMVGVDYEMPRGKWTWSAGIHAGWGMNSVDAPPTFRNRVMAVTGAHDLWLDVNNAVVWGPKFKAWYDYNRRLSFQVDVGYYFARPELQMRANGVLSRHRLTADALVMKAGILFGIF